ncbi:hypothetical protein [Luteimonas aquatica]|uniref:hypothetical protein n=1 Tax=Luteimonas aquatica TaxID=450364 RepID=UPI001F55AD51|nr:hypothetical protein [Luteimonas aquatica]
MKPSSLVLYGVFLPGVLLTGMFLAASAARAGDLDLSLPGATRFGVPYAPPGLRQEADSPVPAEDDGKARIHGSFTTGIGYAKGLGTSTYNRAHINIDKTLGEERQTRLNLDLQVEKIDGPAAGYGYGFGPDPWHRPSRWP